MSDRFEIIDPLSYRNWDQMLGNSTESTFFHTSSWARVLAEAYGYTPIAFARIRNSQLTSLLSCIEVKSFLTGKRCVSLPFSDYCMPILDKGDSITDLLEYVIQYGNRKSWKYLEVRGPLNVEREIPPSSSYYTHALDLEHGEDRIFSRFGRTTKRNIRKAARSGVNTIVSQSLDSIKDYYRLNCITRRDHNLPPQPYVFFSNIYKHIVSKGNGIVILANCQGQTIGGALFLHFGSHAIYKYGASNRYFWDVRPNNAILWEAIRWYCEKGYKRLEFGRTEPENAGLRRFKLGWGTEENSLNYYRYSFKRNQFETQELTQKLNGKRIFNLLPIPVLKVIGRLAYRHVA